MRLFLPVLFAAIALSQQGAAQEGALLGAAAIDGSSIQAYEAEFDFVVYGPDGAQSPGGRWTDSVVVEDGRLSRRVARFNTAGELDLERLIIADAETLAPQLLDQRFGPELQGVMHVDYAAEDVAQVLIPSPSAPMRIVNATFDEPVWELALWATIAQSIPFDENTVVQIPVIAADRQGKAVATFRVEGQETIEANGVSYNATRVVTPEADWTFWVRKEAPYIIQIDHPAGGDGMRALSTLTQFTLNTD